MLASFFRAAADSEAMKIRAHVVYEGRVQGVFFRVNAKKCADALGVSGWIRNTPEGNVEAIYEGDEEKVRQAVELCAEKQPFAKVRSKTVDYSSANGEFREFSIRY